MGIWSMCAAAVVAVGIGSVAEAATYHYGLTYQETFYDEVSVYYDTSDLVFEGDLRSSTDQWGLPTVIPGLVAGSEVLFRLVTDASGVVSCYLGTFNCHPRNDLPYSIWETDPIFVTHEYMYVKFAETARIGTTVELFDIEDAMGHWFELPGYYSASVTNRVASFIVSDLSPAPIPLPATAALLPLGIGALALMRKRRRLS